METFNHPIDPLKESLQNRFNDFELEIDLDMEYILAASSPVAISAVTTPKFNLYTVSKFLIAGTCVTVLSVLYFVNQKSVKNQLPNNVKNTEQTNFTKELGPVTVQPIILDSIKPIEQKKVKNITSPKIVKLKPNDTISKSNILKEVIKIDSIKKELPVEVRKTDFNDFVKNKSKLAKDSIILFKHKK